VFNFCPKLNNNLIVRCRIPIIFVTMHGTKCRFKENFKDTVKLADIKGNLCKKFILNKKSLDLFDQFVSMAEREIDGI